MKCFRWGRNMRDSNEFSRWWSTQLVGGNGQVRNWQHSTQTRASACNSNKTRQRGRRACRPERLSLAAGRRAIEGGTLSCMTTRSAVRLYSLLDSRLLRLPTHARLASRGEAQTARGGREDIVATRSGGYRVERPSQPDGARLSQLRRWWLRRGSSYPRGRSGDGEEPDSHSGNAPR